MAGRIAAIAVDPSNRSHILAASAAGGVWETRDTGATWAPRTDFMPTLTCGAVAFDPTAPNVAWCGTGEGNWYRRFGAGLLRSADGGTTWAVHTAAPFVGLAFYDIVVNGANLVTATTGGVHQSSDGGVTWTQRLTAPTFSLGRRAGSTELLAGSTDGVRRSTDGGVTWTAIALTGGPTGWDRVAVAIAPSSAAVAYIFGVSGPTTYLYRRSGRAGRASTWTRVATLPSDLAVNQSWYDWFLGVSPDNDAQIYLGAINVHRGTLSGSTWTWVNVSSRQGGDSIHPDQHAIAFDPVDPAVVYVGCDGGLYRSPNRGDNWASLNTGLGITEIEYLAQDWGSARWLMAGTQDNGTVRYTGGSEWDHIADGDGGDCAVKRSDPTTVYHSYYGMSLERSATRGNFGSWTGVLAGQPSTYGALFYPPVEANNSTVAKAGQSVFVSRNDGGAFTNVALPTGVGVATAMAMPTSDRIFVGTQNGSVCRLDWSGSAWTVTQVTSPRTGYCSDLIVDATNANRMWATFSQLSGGHVFRSDDGGTQWSDVSANLPSLPVNAIEVDPSNGNRAWVGADLGVYETLNAGGSWSRIGTGLPNVLVEDLAFQPHARLLRAGSRNRGVWECSVDGDLTDPICGVQYRGTVAANASSRVYTFNWPAPWHVIWTVVPTTVHNGSPSITWNVAVERATPEFVTYWVTVTNITADPADVEIRYAILSKY